MLSVLIYPIVGLGRLRRADSVPDQAGEPSGSAEPEPEQETSAAQEHSDAAPPADDT
jgi:hypothetical protein